MLARAFAVRESEDDKQREWGNQSTTWTRLILRRRSTDRSNVGAAPIRECLTRIGARIRRNQFRPSCRGGDWPPAATARRLFTHRHHSSIDKTKTEVTRFHATVTQVLGNDTARIKECALRARKSPSRVTSRAT